jgi:hypothetical protein
LLLFLLTAAHYYRSLGLVYSLPAELISGISLESKFVSFDGLMILLQKEVAISFLMVTFLEIRILLKSDIIIILGPLELE